MSLPVFFHEGAAHGDALVLDGAEGRHAAQVRRLRRGERLAVTDGVGNVATCVVRGVRPAALDLDVVARRSEPRPAPSLVVVQALAKGERAEAAVETMTEVGVDVIVPWRAERSVVRWDDDRAAKGLRRWRARAHEAAKQSRRAWFPEVGGPAGNDGVVALVRRAALAVVLHEEAVRPLAGLSVPGDGELVVVVGPEGGLTDAEVSAFEAAGALSCVLGPTVLRASTAGTVGAALLLAAGGRLVSRPT